MEGAPSPLASRFLLGGLLVLVALGLAGFGVWWTLPVETTWHLSILSEGAGGHDVYVGGTFAGKTPLLLTSEDVARLSDPELEARGLGRGAAGGSSTSPELVLASRAVHPARPGEPCVILMDAVWADGRDEHFALAVKVADATGRALEIGPSTHGSGRVGKRLTQRAKWTFVPP